MAEYINGIKVPETVEELNALGVYARVVCDDLCRTLDRIKEQKGEDEEYNFSDLYSDYSYRSIEDAYIAGFTNLLEQAVTGVTNRLTIGKVRGLGLENKIIYILEDIGRKAGEQFDWWKADEDEGADERSEE